MTHLGYKKIGIILSIVLFGVFFNTITYAQSVTAPTENLTDLTFNILGSILNLLYLITLPVLVIAGKAMDNSMIYGEFINLDKPLYMLRNLSRTFANFAIGGVILRKVVQYIFNFGDNKSPAFLKGLVMKSLGIVLGINFSWFVIGALVDLSTITTYSLGAMPLSILKETNNKDMPILSVGSYFDYQSKASKEDQGATAYIAPHTYYQRGNIYIPRCGEKGEIYKGFITGPEYFPNVPNKPDIKFNTFGDGRQYCALNTQTLADITDLETIKKDRFNSIDNAQANILMKQVIDKIIVTGACEELVLSGYINNTPTAITITANELESIAKTLKIGDGQISSKKVCGGLTITGNAYKENGRSTGFLAGGQEPYASQNGLTMNTLINKSKGMVGPFITLYMSLLDFSNLSIQDTENQTTATTLNGVTEFLLKGAISVALFIPLVALALTLIVRIVILRGVIAFIPLGIVLYGLKDNIKLPGGGMKIGGEEINGGSILGLIFAPVLPVFAISISIIILQTLQIAMKQSTTEDNKTRDFLGIEFFTDTTNNQNTTCMNFWGLQTTCLDKGSEISGGSGFANFLPWLFLNIFAIGLMWMMVKVSLSGSKLTSKIGGNIMDLGSKALGSIPLISIGGRKVGASALGNTFNTGVRTANEALNTAVSQQDRAITDSLGRTEKAKPNTDTSSFSLTNKDKVFSTFKDKISEPIHTASFDNYKKTIANGIQQHGGEKGKEESDKFLTSTTSAQAGVMADFITNLEAEKEKIDKKEIEKLKTIQQQIEDLSQHTVTGGYQEFLDKKDTKKIDQTKIKNFVDYLNNPAIAKLLEDEKTKKTYRQDIITKFSTQIDYKDGKFQATTKQ